MLQTKCLPCGLPEWWDDVPLFRIAGTGLGGRIDIGGSNISLYLDTINTEIK